MAAELIFCDSFDHYTLAQMTGKWTNGAGAAFTSLVSSQRAGNAYQTLFETTITIPGGPRDNMTIGTFRVSNVQGSSQSQLSVSGVAGQCAGVYSVADGTITVVDSTGSVVAQSTVVATEQSVGHYFELGVFCSETVGQIIVRVDGEELINVSNVDTGPSCYIGRILGTGGGTATAYDDLYITWDNASTISFYDDVLIEAISPNGDGNYSQWTPTTGSNWETVDEQPASTTDYNSTDVVNEIDTFTFPDLTFTGTVKGVQFVCMAKKSDVEIRAIQGVCRIGSTDYLSDNIEYLSTTNSFYRFVWAMNPATSAAWTNSEVNSAEFGYKLVV
jgi:hypothetical protein